MVRDAARRCFRITVPDLVSDLRKRSGELLLMFQNTPILEETELQIKQISFDLARAKEFAALYETEFNRFDFSNITEWIFENRTKIALLKRDDFQELMFIFSNEIAQIQGTVSRITQWKLSGLLQTTTPMDEN